MHSDVQDQQRSRSAGLPVSRENRTRESGRARFDPLMERNNMHSARETAHYRDNATEKSSASEDTELGSAEKGARYCHIVGISVWFSMLCIGPGKMLEFTRVFVPLASSGDTQFTYVEAAPMGGPGRLSAEFAADCARPKITIPMLRY